MKDCPLGGRSKSKDTVPCEHWNTFYVDFLFNVFFFFCMLSDACSSLVPTATNGTQGQGSLVKRIASYNVGTYKNLVKYLV